MWENLVMFKLNISVAFVFILTHPILIIIWYLVHNLSITGYESCIGIIYLWSCNIWILFQQLVYRITQVVVYSNTIKHYHAHYWMIYIYFYIYFNNHIEAIHVIRYFSIDKYFLNLFCIIMITHLFLALNSSASTTATKSFNSFLLNWHWNRNKKNISERVLR